jgi:phage baseplate assembly protein W
MGTSYLLSDYNLSQSSNIARQRVYADLDNSFSIHPIYNDVLPLLDLDAVKQSLKNLLLTNTYDRPFQPNIGSNIRNLLFENASILVELELQDKIKKTIAQYEPRIRNPIVNVTDESDKNAYRVSISFEVSYDTNTEIIIYLTRTR